MGFIIIKNWLYKYMFFLVKNNNYLFQTTFFEIVLVKKIRLTLAHVIKTCITSLFILDLKYLCKYVFEMSFTSNLISVSQ